MIDVRTNQSLLRKSRPIHSCGGIPLTEIPAKLFGGKITRNKASGHCPGPQFEVEIDESLRTAGCLLPSDLGPERRLRRLRGDPVVPPTSGGGPRCGQSQITSGRFSE
jgi:hypothetical protein